LIYIFSHDRGKIIQIRSVYSYHKNFSIQCLLNANYTGCGEEIERKIERKKRGKREGKGFHRKKEDIRKEMQERQKRN